MIVGNVEEYIERCLKSFLPIADEVVLVRAIGNQKPDRTLVKAMKVCVEFFAERGKTMPEEFLRTAEYINAPGHRGWPHVDDFAAARQMSFDLATGEYCFWCDSDDVLESGAGLVREWAERGGYAAFVFPYNIFGRGLRVPRERMILKGSGEWEFAVHECFNFHIKPVQAIEDERVVVKHLPHLDKSGSNPRNLRILEEIAERPEKMTTGLWYHLHLERELAGDTEGSIEAAKVCLAQKDLGRPEKYEIFLNLAQAAKDDPEQKHILLHQAHMADPCRREALALLANNALNYDRPEMGLAYARQMMATPAPTIRYWNDRAAVYGWVGEDIFMQALRANGLRGEAESIRLEGLKRAGGPRIALIHATRGRPEQAAKARKIWLDMAEKPDQVEHIFVIDADDEESRALTRLHHLTIAPGGGCVAAWNQGAMSTRAEVLVQMSDDWQPLPGWDELILERLGDIRKPSVLAISDGVRSDKLLCMAIMTRTYWRLDWFMFHPWFTGVYSDNWFTQQAYERGCVIEARDLVFKHQHPIATGEPLDETYARQNAPERYTQGEEVMLALRRKTDWASVPGFFNYWQIYQLIARRIKDGDTIAEVGVWLGRSIIYLAQELKRLEKKNVRILAVDHFKGESNQKEHEATVRMAGGNLRAQFEENIRRCGVADMIEILDGDSAEMAERVGDRKLAFCFIDAAHDYESVKRDIQAWQPKLADGGLFAGHDIDHEEVARAVKECVPEAETIGPCWLASIQEAK